MRLLRKQNLFGLRVVKTAIAVTVSILLVRLIGTQELSVYYGAFGALIAMETTVSRALKQGATQLVGVLAGSVFGYLSVLLFPGTTPAWIVGLGVLLLISLCNRFRLSFTASLSCIIFLSACLTPTDDILRDSLLRLRDTSVGVVVALVINVLVRPYNNKKRILSLLRRLRRAVPEKLSCIVVREQFPELQDDVALLRRIDAELELYHSQHLFHRKNDAEALLRGCYQLAQRMLQELEAICGMDSLGDLATENRERMRALGFALPSPELPPRKCTRHDTIVMNYHLEKLLSAYQYLGELMEE